MPKHSESVLGGHAVVCCGYDDSKQVFICRNSWGKNWGDSGYFYMPYQYLLARNLSSDFWAIETVK
jgi:C1A family cysteine protease